MDLFTKLCGSLLVLCVALVYGEEEPCGGHLDASDAGYITTPGYPLEYPPHQNCRWVITAPEPSQRIVLNFNPHFELEKLDSLTFQKLLLKVSSLSTSSEHSIR
uniref:Neuropilin 2b n=1 Tax=Cyprinus carpio TaxID=7962 RepID=A0A8C2KQ28_CYPCA